MVVDDKEKFIYFLLSDSSIHSVNIQGSGYLPIQRHNATNLESIHLIPKTESNHINLMAISNKGDRLYFSCKDKKIDLVYTRPSPPLPGSLLFNDLTKETSELSFYNHGVFAAVLGKSKRTYLVMTNANSIRDADSTPVSSIINEKVLLLITSCRFSWKMYIANLSTKKYGQLSKTIQRMHYPTIISRKLQNHQKAQHVSSQHSQLLASHITLSNDLLIIYQKLYLPLIQMIFYLS